MTSITGKTVGFDGAPPKDPAKIRARQQRKAAIDALVKLLKPEVEKRLADRPMYALRHTHITWARRFANFDAVRAQVGHAGRDIQEEHYNDENFVDAASSSLAVWEVLTGVKELKRTAAEAVLAEAVGQVAPVVAPVEKIKQNDGKEGNSQSLMELGDDGGSPGCTPRQRWHTLRRSERSSCGDGARRADGQPTEHPFSCAPWCLGARRDHRPGKDSS